MQMVFLFPIIDSLRGEPPSTPKLSLEVRPCQAAVHEVLKQTFKYDPSIRKKAEEEDLLGDDVIKLEPFLVTEKKVSPYLVSDLDRKRELFEASKPSLTNGIGKSITPNVSVGIMPYDYKFLPSGAPLPRWNLINIRL